MDRVSIFRGGSASDLFLGKFEMAKIITERTRFPSNVESRRRVIFNSINAEPKSITLLGLLGGNDLTERELKEKIELDCRRTGLLYMGNGVIKGYILNGLYPAGLVFKETTLSRGERASRVGYRISKNGLHYGLPIAAFSIEWAVKNQMSMYSILGSASAFGEDGSPNNAVRILEALAENGEMRMTDIVEEIGCMKGNVHAHLKRLSGLGFVNFDSIGRVSKIMNRYARCKFVQSPSEVLAVNKYVHLTKRVYSALKDAKEDDIDSLAKSLGVDRRICRRIISGLIKQGHAKRVEENRFDSRSKAKILERGIDFVNGYIGPINDALGDGPWLEKMRAESLRHMVHDEKLYRDNLVSALTFYNLVSPHKNFKDEETRIKEILAIFKPLEELTIDEVSEGINLNPTATRNLLNKIIAAGGNKINFRVNEDRQKVYILGQK